MYNSAVLNYQAPAAITTAHYYEAKPVATKGYYYAQTTAAVRHYPSYGMPVAKPMPSAYLSPTSTAVQTRTSSVVGPSDYMSQMSATATATTTDLQASVVSSSRSMKAHCFLIALLLAL